MHAIKYTTRNTWYWKDDWRNDSTRTIDRGGAYPDTIKSSAVIHRIPADVMKNTDSLISICGRIVSHQFTHSIVDITHNVRVFDMPIPRDENVVNAGDGEIRRHRTT